MTRAYTKVYTVQIDRIPGENKRWYFGHKGEFFSCVLINKASFDSDKLSPQFLVVQKDESGEFAPALIFRTIRPLDATVINESVVDSEPLYHLIENIN